MISIIILTFNSKEFIKPCIDSISAQNYQDFEVIIVDNGSKDDTVRFIKENYPQIILIENKENLGACKARNEGIEIAQGRWILTLDCDIILGKNFLNKIIKFTEETEDSVGMLQPKILNNIDKKTIYSCGIYLSWLRRFYDIGKGKIDNGKFDIQKYIFGACSASALYRKSMLEEIKEDTGYFDERFFFLVEDVDLSWRAQRMGWKALFYPRVVCYHSGNSSDTSKKTKQYFCFRNRFFMIFKNEKLITIILKLPFYLIYDLPRSMFLMIRKVVR